MMFLGISLPRRVPLYHVFLSEHAREANIVRAYALPKMELCRTKGLTLAKHRR
jgi:hypothetical protein